MCVCKHRPVAHPQPRRQQRASKAQPVLLFLLSPHDASATSLNLYYLSLEQPTHLLSHSKRHRESKANASGQASTLTVSCRSAGDQECFATGMRPQGRALGMLPGVGPAWALGPSEQVSASLCGVRQAYRQQQVCLARIRTFGLRERGRQRRP